MDISQNILLDAFGNEDPEATLQSILQSIVLDEPAVDLPPAPLFHPGVATIRPMSSRRYRRQNRRNALQDAAPHTPLINPFLPWEQRTAEPPAPGTLRLLTPPPSELQISLQNLWGSDRTLTEWVNLWTAENTEFEDAVYGEDYRAQIRAMFEANQRSRYLARWVIQRWRVRMWMKRTACNVDLIENQPVTAVDALYVCDTTNRTIYKFHRRDIYNNLLSNICASDEMLPCPRPPTNPWTNQPLTLPQTIAVCQQLVADYARRGRCPPVLFSAFWAARFDLSRFEQENATLLAQHAVTSYFKDLNDDAILTVFDTLTSLLVEAGCDFMPTAIRRWLRATPQTDFHRDWLAMVRDYTMYMNLHVQIRPSWHTRDHILADVRRLYARTWLPDPTSQQVRALRNLQQAPVLPPVQPLMPNSVSLLGLPLVTNLQDISGGGGMGYNTALQLIHQALFRM